MPDDYLASKGFRIVVVKNHIVFFVIREELLNGPKRVLVMRVLYCRRDWARILKCDTEYAEGLDMYEY